MSPKGTAVGRSRSERTARTPAIARAPAAPCFGDDDRPQEQRARLRAQAQRRDDRAVVPRGEELLVRLERDLAAERAAVERFDVRTLARWDRTDRDAHRVRATARTASRIFP